MIKLVNLDEVFAMAIQIEDNGARFYRKAAELHDGGTGRDYFKKLAVMEEGHKEQFEDMRASAAKRGDTEVELDQEGGLYLEAIASGYRLEGSPKVTAELTGDEGVVDVLRIGADLEKQAILFYMGLKKMMTDDASQRALDGIVDQEKAHLVTLTSELKRETGD